MERLVGLSRKSNRNRMLLVSNSQFSGPIKRIVAFPIPIKYIPMVEDNKGREATIIGNPRNSIFRVSEKNNDTPDAIDVPVEFPSASRG